MTPPPSADTLDISAEMNAESLNRLKWFGWVALGAVALGWIAWVSDGVIGAGQADVRQRHQYEQLREDLAEIKSLLRDLLKQGAVP